FFRSPIFRHPAFVVTSAARWKSRTSICRVRRSYPFAKHRARRLRATPSAANASRCDAPESICADRHPPKFAPPRPARARDLLQPSHDEQTRHLAFAYRSRVTDRPRSNRVPEREVTLGHRLARPSRRRTAFDREQCSLHPLVCPAKPFRQLIQSRENRTL